MPEPQDETFNVETALRRLAQRSDRLTGGQGDVSVAYDGGTANPWYVASQ